MDYIQLGKENAIMRGELCLLLSLPDRTVRKMIQEARDRGEVILNDQSGAGYYTSDDVGELERQLRRNENRALSILRQQRHIRFRLEAMRNRDQVTIEEVSGSG